MTSSSAPTLKVDVRALSVTRTEKVITAERPEWRQKQDGSSPWFAVASAWLLLAAFSLYGADELRRRVIDHETLGRTPAAVDAATALERLASQTPVRRFRDRLDELGAQARGRHLALSETASPAPKPPATGPATGPTPSTRGETVAAALRQGPLAVPVRQRRVLLVGASSMEFYLGAELERRLETHRGIEVRRFARLGTGLARPDIFDWPKTIRELTASFKPDVVIAQFGGNEAQTIETADGSLHRFGTAGWDREYRRRVGGLVDQVRRSGARIVFLGVQLTRHPKISRQFAAVNKLTREEAERRGAPFISTWELVADPTGAPRRTIEVEGRSMPLYLRDGVHYSRPGARWLVDRLTFRLEALLELTPRDPRLARVRLFEHRSRARGKMVRFLTYLPQPGSDETQRLPAVVLLHGAGGSPFDFGVHAHRALQSFAGRHRLAIIAPDGDPDGWYVDSAKVSGARIATHLLDELLPQAASLLSISRWSIAGISMGGNGALALALKRPELFEAVSALSGAVDLSEAASRPALIARLGPYPRNKAAWHQWSAQHLVAARPEAAGALPVLLTVGDGDRWAPANRRLHQALIERGSNAVLDVQPGAHDWKHWTQVLPRHLEWHAQRLGAAPVN